MKKNCWEMKGCERQPGGSRVRENGVCPAAADESSHGVNQGHNGGRICWAIAGTFCGGVVQGDFAQKQLSCLNCEVYRTVFQEEGPGFTLQKPESTRASNPKRKVA